VNQPRPLPRSGRSAPFRGALLLAVLVPLVLVVGVEAGPNRYGHSDRVERHMLPAVSTGPMDPAWSPDGRWIAFSMRGDIWKVPAQGGDAVALTQGPAYHFEPAWSPDGSRIALSMDVDGNLDIGVVSAEGGAVRRITSHPQVDVEPAWSADGTRLYFVSARGRGFRIYRQSLADTAAVEYKSKAISLVIAGGIVGGFIGPETSKLTYDLVAGYVYAGAYFSLVAFALLAILILRWLQIPLLPESERKAAGRPMGNIARQPAFIIAVLCGMVSYGVMNLLMTATPLAITGHQHPFSDAAFVIQWHIVGMFAPSFVTGSLIQRFGLARIMLTGVALNLASVAIALAGVDVMNFWLAMLLLGVGWNFMFVGATALLTEVHTPAERAKVQGVNDAAIFLTMVVSSFSSGALFTYQGWHTMNLWAVPFLALAGAAILWLAAVRGRRLRRCVSKTGR